VVLASPESGDTWLGLSPDRLPSSEVADWVVMPGCGAVVQFSGTARDHSVDRPGVDRLEYEAYDEVVEPRLDSIASEMRRRWGDLGRIAVLHRVGCVAVGDPAVVVAVSSPHRDAAFEAARFAIDTLKATVPIWKRERWQGGESWGLEPQHIADVPSLDGAETGPPAIGARPEAAR
jgi:molybdopterin synthase catalytic subunit